MHVSGGATRCRSATVLRDALVLSNTPLSAVRSTPPPRHRGSTSNQAALQRALGQSGKVNGGVLQFSIPRADPITEDGMEVPRGHGYQRSPSTQQSGRGREGRRDGDFVLTASEVNPVIKALRDNQIEVTALHNHMINEEPRALLHAFLGQRRGRQGCARSLRAALDQVRLAGSEPKKDLPAGCKDILANQPAHTRDEVAKCGQGE